MLLAVACVPWVHAEVPAHPRLFFDAAELTRLKDMARSEANGHLGISPKSIFDAIAQRAEASRAEALKGLQDEYVLRTLDVRLYDLTLVYAITGDAKVLASLLRDLSQLVRANSWGGMDGVFGMVSAGTGVAFAYDTLYSMLDEVEEIELEPYLKKRGLSDGAAKLGGEEAAFEKPDTGDEGGAAAPEVPKDMMKGHGAPTWKVPGRKALREALLQRVVKPLESAARTGQLTEVSNIPVIQLAALGLVSLALLGEPECPEADNWLRSAETSLVKILDASDPDGGWIEGLGYGTHAMDKLIIFADALKRVTGRNLMTHPAVRNLPQFALHTASPDGRFGVGFCDTWGYPGFQLSALRLGRESQDPCAAWYLHHVGYPNISEGIHPFIFYHDSVSPQSPEGRLPHGRLFRGIGWATWRASWDDPNGIFFALKSGPDGNHTQNDQNHFELYAWGAYLSTDQGYTHRRAWRGGTIGHNSLLIDGEGQCCGWVNGRSGRILEFLAAPAFGYAKANANSYGTRQPLLDWFIRRVHFTPPDYVVIFDDVKSRNDVPRRATSLLQITREHSRPQKGEIEIGSNEAYLVPESSRAYLQAIFLAPPDVRLSRRTHYDRSVDELTGPYLAAETPGKLPRQQFLCVLLPRRVPEPAEPAQPIAATSLETEGGLGACVHSPVSDDIHLFRSADDGRVSSGAISCDGATALLSRDPSGQTTRFALAEGRSLTQGNQVLVNSPSQVTAAFSTWSSYEVRGGSRLPKAEPGRFFGTMSLHEKSQVRFWCPFVPARVLLNGQPAAAFTFDPKSGLCSIELPEGPHSLELFAQ